MQKIIGLFFLLVTVKIGAAQSFGARMESAWNKFTQDEQLQYGLAGICVMDATTGRVVFERNSRVGMAPASTQKVLTTIAAYEAFGNNFTYQTKLGYIGNIANKKLTGDLVIEGSGDPTFGSWRYENTKPNSIYQQIAAALQQKGIDSITGDFVGTDKGFDLNPIPDNWMWGDIGNYYGAGHWGLNWGENQYDVFFKSGASKGDATKVVDVDPEESIVGKLIHNEVATGTANTGDGSVIYGAPYSPFKLIQGNISSNENRFKVSGSFSWADMNCLTSIQISLAKAGIKMGGKPIPTSAKVILPAPLPLKGTVNYFLTLPSPTLDSIVYWFLKKSVNLYGEALVRTIGLQKKGFGSTDKGLEWIDSFYRAKGLDTKAMHMTDGSGLGPTNRTTPMFFVQALRYAKDKPWFNGFYEALPLYNNMKLKSGTIHRTKCFAGYHGNYIVSFMVNNYNGSSSGLVDKMFKVLDELKK